MSTFQVISSKTPSGRPCSLSVLFYLKEQLLINADDFEHKHSERLSLGSCSSGPPRPVSAMRLPLRCASPLPRQGHWRPHCRRSHGEADRVHGLAPLTPAAQTLNRGCLWQISRHECSLLQLRPNDPRVSSCVYKTAGILLFWKDWIFFWRSVNFSR